MSSDIIRDFDQIIPPKRLAKIGGEDVDVSIFSTRATLKLIEMTDTPEKLEQLENCQNIDGFVDVVATACQRSNPVITKDWLLDNIDMITLIEFAKFVLEPILKKMDELDQVEDKTGKN